MNQIKYSLSRFFKILVSPIVFIIGYIYFCLTKKTNNLIYQSYVKSYCLTSGYISKFITGLIILLQSKSKKKKISTNPDNKTIVKELNDNGYVVLKNKLNQNFVEDLLNITKNLKCTNNQLSKNIPKVIFDKTIHKLSTYYYSENELIKNTKVLQIIDYLQKLSISEEYFKSKPYLVAVNMWWSTVNDNADSNAAQNYHFDLDGIKWLKYFVYLTDVTVTSGPHVYVEGTHKPFSKPYNILKRGYQRVSDKEIQNCYSSEKIKMITGKKGTIIIGDTSCFHKGLVPKEEIRLIFEATFSNSFFGPDLVNKKKINQLNF